MSEGFTRRDLRPTCSRVELVFWLKLWSDQPTYAETHNFKTRGLVIWQRLIVFHDLRGLPELVEGAGDVRVELIGK